MTDPIARLNVALEGRYRIEREVGQGGMATVYLADDLRHERKVALKVLKPDLAAVVGAERFLAEIRTTANLQHPHILPLYDSGEAGGFLFFVMPYVEGGTLADRLSRESQLSVEDALDIARKVGSALDYAHDELVVHRDIKPGNILLSERGEPMVADFGIALAVAHAGEGRFTETGLSLGTPHYMSPEQATGDQDVSPRSDIYALGCVLYEMLAGEPPFHGGTAQAVLGRILTGEVPSITSVRKAVPVNVDHAIRHALERLPADRFETAGAFIKALGNPAFRYGEVEGAEAAAASASRWRTIALAAAGIAVVAGLLAGWGFARGRASPPPVTREVIVVDGFGLATAPLGRLAAFSPDGSSLVMYHGTATDGQFWVRTRGSLEWNPLPGTENARDVVFSPDGEWIAYVIGNELIKRPIVGGSTVTLANDGDDGAVSIAWLDDRTIVYEPEPIDGVGQMVRISEDGGEPLEVAFDLGEGADRLGAVWAHPLPSARGFLLISCPNGNCAGTELHVVDLENDTSRLLLEGVRRAWYVEPDQVIYVRDDGAVFMARMDPETLERGPGSPLFEGVRTVLGADGADMVLGADGTLLYIEGGAAGAGMSELVWVDRTGREEPVDPDMTPRGFVTLALSPDERRIAVSIGEGATDIWVKELPDGPMNRITDDPGNTRRPIWSVDGDSVAYFTNDGGSQHARVVRADGSSLGGFAVLLERERPLFEVAFTPDGRGMIFREGNAATGDADLGYMDRESGDVNDTLLASQFNERAIALSPDGTLLAYVSDVTGRDQVFLRRFPETGSGQRQVSINGGIEPVWAHSGTELFFREPGTGDLMVAAISESPALEVTNRDRLFDASGYAQTEGTSYHSYDVNPDDQRFLFMKPVGGDEGDPGRLVLVRNWFTELGERLGR